jgi:hypothetical protein
MYLSNLNFPAGVDGIILDEPSASYTIVCPTTLIAWFGLNRELDYSIVSHMYHTIQTTADLTLA